MEGLTEEKKKEYLKKMEECSSLDTECGHIEADDLLIDILKDIGGFDNIISAYENVDKWFA